VPSQKSAHKPLLKSEVNLDDCAVLIHSARARPRSTPKTRLIRVPDMLAPLLEREMEQTEGSFVFGVLYNASRDFDAALRRAGIDKLDTLGRKLTITGV